MHSLTMITFPCRHHRTCPIGLWHRLAEWRRRAVTRRELAGLDSRMLQDIGASADEALRESKKRFWIP